MILSLTRTDNKMTIKLGSTGCVKQIRISLSPFLVVFFFNSVNAPWKGSYISVCVMEGKRLRNNHIQPSRRATSWVANIVSCAMLLIV